MRLDWEYGALPVALTPLVTEEADVVVVHSSAVERMVAAAGRAERIERIPHGIDADVFHEEGAVSRRVSEFKSGRPAVLFVGGLIWRKGMDVLLSAWLRGVAHRPPAVLVIKSVGSDRCYAGYHLGELVDRVRRHRGDDVLVIEDDLTCSELAAIYRACDLFVHPYRGEGFGMPVLEARACGLPVLVTRGGSTDDFCVGESCVGIRASRRVVDLPEAHVGQPWVLEPDARELDAALIAALGRLPQLRRAARADAPAVRARYTWTAAAAAIERLAGKPPARRAGPTAGPAAPRRLPNPHYMS